jgi:hypothetical protein
MNHYEELENKMFHQMPFTAHDGDIVQIKIDGDRIIVRYALGECDYLWAEDTFQDYWKNPKNLLIVDQIFDGVQITEYEDEGLSFVGAECLVNDFDPDNHTFELVGLQHGNGAEIEVTLKISFSEVAYKIFGEIPAEKYEKMAKSINHPDKTKWDKIYTIEM